MAWVDEKPPHILDYEFPPEPEQAALQKRTATYRWVYITGGSIALGCMGLLAIFSDTPLAGLFCLTMGMGFIVAFIFGVQWACAPEPPGTRPAQDEQSPD